MFPVSAQHPGNYRGGDEKGVSRDYGKFRFYRRKARSNLEVETGAGSLN